MNQVEFQLTDQLDENITRQIDDGLRAHNRQYGGDAKKKDLLITVRGDTGKLAGGLYGITHWGWLYVKNLWVAEEMRGRRVGAELIAKAEAEARLRGCHSAYLDTFSFQAEGFYKKQGYGVYGRLEDFPHGKSRIYLTKKL